MARTAMQRHIPLRTKRKVWARDVGKGKSVGFCQMGCGAQVGVPRSLWAFSSPPPLQLPIAHFGHLQPHCRGGSVDANNLCILCPRCNLGMGSQHPADYCLPMDCEDHHLPFVAMWTDSDVFCGVLTRKGQPCRNKKLPGEPTCATHRHLQIAM